MNCIFDSFDKKEVTTNPFFQPNKNIPSKFIFPSGNSLAQAVQYSQNPVKTSSNLSLFSFKTQTNNEDKNNDNKNIPNIFNNIQIPLFTKSEIPVRITKYTSQITNNKILAIMSSESYVNNQDITSISQLKYIFNSKMQDVTKISPLVIVSIVDKSVLNDLLPLSKLHVTFLQELIEEKVSTEEEVWKCIEKLAFSYGLYTILQYISQAKHLKKLVLDSQQQITPEISYVLALHTFITNNDKPHDVIAISKDFTTKSNDIVKLATDMCMASYGLNWILGSQTNEYINKHRNTYILSY